MLTSKQRSNLKALAANLQPVAQVGKGGVNENMVKSLSDALEARELIKISVLTNAENEAKETARRSPKRSKPTALPSSAERSSVPPLFEKGSSSTSILKKAVPRGLLFPTFVSGSPEKPHRHGEAQ